MMDTRKILRMERSVDTLRKELHETIRIAQVKLVSLDKITADLISLRELEARKRGGK